MVQVIAGSAGAGAGPGRERGPPEPQDRAAPAGAAAKVSSSGPNRSTSSPWCHASVVVSRRPSMVRASAPTGDGRHREGHRDRRRPAVPGGPGDQPVAAPGTDLDREPPVAGPGQDSGGQQVGGHGNSEAPPRAPPPPPPPVRGRMA